MNYIDTNAKDRRYFSSTRKYTLALLNAFNNVKYWVEADNSEFEREYIIPIEFGNYEKANSLEDINYNTDKANYNFLPRLVLSFEGMTKNTERQTNKFKKISKKVYDPENNKVSMDVAYNSVSYDFHYTLLLQTRGLTIATQVIEEILVKFNPTLNLNIHEFPLFQEKTETQILISDPAFEIQSEQAPEDINLVQVTMDLTIRGNVYGPIEMTGPIETIKMFTHVWDEVEKEESKLASYYKFDVSKDTGKIFRQTERHFDGTLKNDQVVEEQEETVIEERPDYSPSEIFQEYDIGTEFILSTD